MCYLFFLTASPALMIFGTLKNCDPEAYGLIKAEETRQRESLELIASENFTSVGVLQANGSILTNKYSEGQVGQRYYGGNEYIDAMEQLCKDRALALYKLDPREWDVNVQALSGTVANLAVYTALAGKDGRILGMDLPSGGHLSHGYKTLKRKISASSIFFESASYKCTADGQLDYSALSEQAKSFRPDILICGASAFPRDFDYERLRVIAGDAFLMMDMSHISGLIAAGLMNNPFEHCDVVTTTTHKLLRGPRSSLIFYRREKTRLIDGTEHKIDVKAAIDFAVFPALQGGPHNQKIAATAVALRQANSEEYFEYARQVCANAKALEERLKEHGHRLYTGGTDCHMLLICLDGIGGAEVELICELANISINKNCTVTDRSPLRPSGIRLGTAAMTTRGFKEADFVHVADLIHEAIEIARQVNKDASSNLKKFHELAIKLPELETLKQRVVKSVSSLPFPCL